MPLDSPILERYLDLIDDRTALQDCLDRPLPVCLWVNPIKATLDQVQDFLRAQGLHPEPLPWYPGALRVPDWSKPGDNLAFGTGWYYVQEEIALTAVEALDPQPGERILDLCAAPGGKTAQIALRLRGTGTVVANELQIDRLSSLSNTIARLGLLNVIATNHDGREAPLPAHSFDRVLVDVPCSGEGTLRKSRAACLGWNPVYSQRIVGAQRKLLDRALQLVKPGGILVYSTCTFAPEENEAILDRVVGARGILEPIELPGLKTMPGLRGWQGSSFRRDMDNACRFFPHFNDTGGFFLARIRRTEAQLTPPEPIQPPETLQQLAIDDHPAIAALCDRFGLSRDWLSQYHLWRKGKHKIWISEPTCNPEGITQAQSIGVLFIRTKGKIPKPTTFALQRFAPDLQRNRIELSSPESLDQFWQRHPQPWQTDDLTPGFVHVRYPPFELGCGHYRPGTLQSHIPKSIASV